MAGTSALKILSCSDVSTTQLLAAGLLLTTVCITAHMVYNMFFHPLAKFPGPRLAAATSFVYWYHWLNGNTLHYFESTHHDYGEVVRIAPDRLIFINPQAWKDVYGHKSAKHKTNPKDPAFYAPEANGVHSLLSIQDDSEHARVRRIFSHAFSDKALRDQGDMIRTHIDKLMRNMRDTKGESFDAVVYYNCTTFDVMADLTFGESLGLLDNSEYNQWLSSALGGLKYAAYAAMLDEFPRVKSIAQLFVPKSLVDAQMQSFEYSAQRVAKRLEKGAVTERPDIWSLVLDKEESKSLTVDEMNATSSLFMLAGSETQATSLSGLTYHLLMNPDKMRKLVDEIRGEILNEEDLTIDNLRQLKYLQACFDEGMRIYPAVPTGPPRVTPKGGNTVLGRYIPENTRILIPQLASYHSPSNFTNPKSFVPERWLPDEPGYEEYKNDKREMCQPFSYGPRNCIGKNLAYHEMRLILAKTLWNFDLELCPESRGTWTEQKMWWGLWEKNPLMVRATPVKR
ncbi:Cytochrome p450 protein [Lasiodiplodia theobromae]|uniref:Cytochrome p450 protein n=1 Tax=Lasiodiplodia theobromae TaxID=45133 RepID=UPI0015C38BCA|nr:Cytochrome p450 protein [Lasiodiplodia theobromae]KAF4534596.1 Cytochrome p450 protein [Lasiodiplodia theobromae]